MQDRTVTAIVGIVAIIAGSIIIILADKPHHISEAERTEAYNEGFEVGLCVAHRNFMKLDTADCFERELR